MPYPGFKSRFRAGQAKLEGHPGRELAMPRNTLKALAFWKSFQLLQL